MLTDILLALTPFVVWASTAVAKVLFNAIPKFLIPILIVPALSVLVTVISGWIDPGTGSLVQIALGLLAVFVDNILKYLKEQ